MMAVFLMKASSQKFLADRPSPSRMDTFHYQSFPWESRFGDPLLSLRPAGCFAKSLAGRKFLHANHYCLLSITNPGTDPGWGCGSSYTEDRRS